MTRIEKDHEEEDDEYDQRIFKQYMSQVKNDKFVQHLNQPIMS
jgi:hypothetical protein